MLVVENLAAAYGEVEVLHGISLEVVEKRIIAVLGANGAGKTTLLRTISGLLRPKRGTILLDGRQIERLSPERIVHLGVSHVPQGRRIFPGLTVYENLLVAQTPASKRSPTSWENQLQETYELFPTLRERRDQLGWSLSGGEQQMLAIARALVARPRLILLDEPSLGLAPIVVETLFSAVEDICRRDALTILLIEQNVHQALRVADYVYVMEIGSIVAEGDPVSLARNPEIEKAYLGA